MMKAVFPGSFDPPTNGHLNLIERASRVFDVVEVVIGDNSDKRNLFSVEDRITLLKEITYDIDNVRVGVTDKLIVEYAKEVGASVMLRGVRALTDFGYEFELAMINKSLDPNIEIMFMPTDPKYFVVRSSNVNELARMKGKITGLVPECVEKALREKFG
ncbi:MAG: pantetheine-phosphate adenylyltransferase [Spirochaetales bacterium]|uniref:Phosphopantetheine adenylyltransferase n=1 Tax=Candidatus Thalassospirochaeta sargassi TaxID=3119039 RepID=A0AAJ1IAV9_9SPIO|nr:pantetheine-phosphate adenylyltransferase [Spirochaetales bacterium]